MRVVTLARRPMLEVNVASNVLRHGAAAVFISASRVSTSETISNHSRGTESAKSKGRFGDSKAQDTHQTEGQKLGRFPANMLLLHAGCGEGCGEGCAVLDLDLSAGDRPVSGAAQTGRAAVGGKTGQATVKWGIESGTGMLHNDSGGASRYYKQFHREVGMRELPQDLIDYLYTMITPTKVQLGGDADGETLVAMDLSQVVWSEYEDEQLHGMITQGDPTPWMDEVWRVLKPGAHVMLIAPPEQPTGHTGTCALEDKGFEIRDSILVVEEPGKIHYVPKANPKERNAGCHELAAKKKTWGPIYDLATEDEDVVGEVLAALVEARAESGVEAGKHPVDKITADNIYEVGLPKNVIPSAVRDHFKRRKDQKNAHGNDHPCVKPKEVLKRLLASVPKDAPVLDPFMGSGSMALACLETGHDYIGVEKEAEYVEIADARVRHWDAANTGWVRAEIKSEAQATPDKPDTFLDDLFGF